MLTDRQGNTVTGANGKAVELFDYAVEAFNLYRGDPIALVNEAIAAAPEFTMAHALKAYLYAVATEPQAAAEARTIVEQAHSMSANEREASHLRAIDLVLQGQWTAAALALDHHNVRFPLDLIGVQCGHLMDFYRGNARDLRDRMARVLPQWSPSVPGFPVVLGMYAFGLEEMGDYARAEETGRRALDTEPRDAWAHHAVAHVMEMQGRAQDGVGWMMTREPTWSGDDNFFKVHNWWHRAVFHLDLGQIDQVLALYDGPIRKDRSAVVLDMIDASALLWRLHLCGHDVGDRWQELASLWDQHADGLLYPFNDWHAVMAYLGSGRHDQIERIIRTYREHAEDKTETAAWAREIALPLIEGFTAFWHGDHERAVARLYPVRFIANRFGGSHAQRDIIDWTLAEAAVRGGMRDLAEALASERLAQKPHSPLNRSFLARAKVRKPAPARAA
ncbi:MAG: tetratricopeptide repeat protein [Defluviicoccus sp.]